MDFIDTLRSINVVDIVVILYLFGWFVLGYIQGTVRRIVGILSIVFSFFLALQLNDFWLGEFLAQNWQQYPPEYSVMIGYLVIFVAGVVAFSLVIQGTYRKAELFAKYPVVDEVLGGFLGVIQGGLLLMFLVTILDQYFLNGSATEGNQLPFLGGFWTAINGSETGRILHETIIPSFLSIFSFLVPSEVLATYGLS
ncbi:MAG TPA: CvpA family protein [Candidatus Limnocylindrales bacterium]|nr:CvpA family protein [Candidatus Limnocylindrales bacterium]